MRNPVSISLCILAFLLLLVLVGVQQSGKNEFSENARSFEEASANSPKKSLMENTFTEGQGDQKGHPSLQGSSLAKNPAQPPRATPPSALQREQFLKKRLVRDEASLTRELLPDGTELIHLNGSQAHFSAATLAADGSVKVQCHSSYEGLVNQTSQVASPSLPNPSNPIR